MLKFTYVKNQHDVEDRELIVMASPSETYFGIDLSTIPEAEYTVEEKEILEAKIQSFLDEQKNDFNDFIYELGLNGAYRRFKPEKMLFTLVEKK